MTARDHQQEGDTCPTEYEIWIHRNSNHYGTPTVMHTAGKHMRGVLTNLSNTNMHILYYTCMQMVIRKAI